MLIYPDLSYKMQRAIINNNLIEVIFIAFVPKLGEGTPPLSSRAASVGKFES